MATENDPKPMNKKTPDELRRMLHHAEVQLQQKKKDKKCAMAAYKDDIDGYNDEIKDILEQLEQAK